MTLIFVAYRTERIDASWARAEEVVVVHNDDKPLELNAPPEVPVVHLGGQGNVGFGAAVDLALGGVNTRRVVLCNPDVALLGEHWAALVDADPDEIVTVPLDDVSGVPTSVVNRYPTPLVHLATGWRLGRVAPRGSWLRRQLSRLLGRWGRRHESALHRPVGTYPLATHWVSGAVMSIDSERLRAVGGFDGRYFLYFEDVDLCRRLAQVHPHMVIRVADTPPGVHLVGASATTVTERHRRASAVRYARSRQGVRWRAVAILLGGIRSRWPR
jgi:GT2 family glycosyltransferase